MVKISVILPVRNGNPDHFKLSVESILHQTFSDFELIIVDDSDDDSNEKLAKSYNDARIKIIQGGHKNLAAAINRGMDIAQGEYIARMDSDDISYPERFQKQVDFLDSHFEISLLGTAYREIPAGKVIIFPENLKYMDILQKCYLVHPSVMFRKSDFEKYNLRYTEEFSVAEDYELWSRAVKYLNIANLKDVLLDYRVNKDSLYHANTKKVFEKDIIIRENMLEFLSDNKEWQDELFKFVCMRKKLSLKEKIFSIKNERRRNEKWKLVSLFGFRFRYKVKSEI